MLSAGCQLPLGRICTPERLRELARVCKTSRALREASMLGLGLLALARDCVSELREFEAA
jgi:hypothetical protein